MIFYSIECIEGLLTRISDKDYGCLKRQRQRKRKDSWYSYLENSFENSKWWIWEESAAILGFTRFCYFIRKRKSKAMDINISMRERQQFIKIHCSHEYTAGRRRILHRRQRRQLQMKLLSTVKEVVKDYKIAETTYFLIISGYKISGI